MVLVGAVCSNLTIGLYRMHGLGSLGAINVTGVLPLAPLLAGVAWCRFRLLHTALLRPVQRILSTLGVGQRIFLIACTVESAGRQPYCDGTHACWHLCACSKKLYCRACSCLLLPWVISLMLGISSGCAHHVLALLCELCRCVRTQL